MSERPRILLSWSSGKDSAWALHLLREQQLEVVGLLTTINSAFDRVAMHGVRRELVELQAQAANLPLILAPLPWPCSNDDYDKAITQALEHAVTLFGVNVVAFGDLFLEDIRRFREETLSRHAGLTALFPLWDLPTGPLAEKMITGGLKARLVCVDSKQLSPHFAGRDFDLALLKQLPNNTDPCGERGEFHTFVYGGPFFDKPLDVKMGETIERDGFVYADVLPR